MQTVQASKEGNIDLLRKTRVKRETYFLKFCSIPSVQQGQPPSIVASCNYHRPLSRREQLSSWTSSCAIVVNRANMNPTKTLCRPKEWSLVLLIRAEFFATHQDLFPSASTRRNLKLQRHVPNARGQPWRRSQARVLTRHRPDRFSQSPHLEPESKEMPERTKFEARAVRYCRCSPTYNDRSFRLTSKL